MTKPVNTVPPLPYPSSRHSLDSLATFDQDLIKALHVYLIDLARRANVGLSRDGTEPMEASLDLGGFNITNVGNITISGTVTLTTPLPIAQGGSGASTQAGARTNFGLGSAAVENIGTSGATVPLLNGVNTFSGANTLSATTTQSGLLDLTSGQLKFPATQVPSANANTLDDYEEGTWTPTITALSGSFTSVSATGVYTKIGRTVCAEITVNITTNGTAAGYIQATLPFTPGNNAVFFGREFNVHGRMLIGIITSGSGTATIVENASVYPGADGYGLRINGVYTV